MCDAEHIAPRCTGGASPARYRLHPARECDSNAYTLGYGIRDTRVAAMRGAS